MKIKFIILFLTIWVSNSNAQITFNKGHIFGFENSVATSIIQTDTCYFLGGVFTDFLNDSTILEGTYLAQLDFEGNLVKLSTLVDSTAEVEYNHWHPNLYLDHESGYFYQSGYQNISGKLIPYMSKFNENFEIEFLTTCQSQFLNSMFEVDTDFQILNNGSIILVTRCQRDDQGQNPGTEICLFKLDRFGNQRWSKMIERDSFRQFTGDIDLTPDSNLILFGGEDFQHIDRIPDTRVQVIKMDTSGNILNAWRSTWQDSLWKSFSGIPLEDGGYIVSCHKAIELVKDRTLIDDPMLIKLDADLKEEWRYFLFNRTDTLFSGGLINAKVISDEFSHDYVVVGNYHRGSPNDPNEDYSDTFGRIEKISKEGQMIWQRFYQFYGDETFIDRHEFRDVFQTNDGGYIACGKADDASIFVENSLRSWVVKLDEYGCLVPGCQGPVSTSAISEESDAIRFKATPNPVQTNLNIYVYTSSSFTKGDIHLTDFNGKRIGSYPIQIDNLTLSINVSNLAKGMYVLSYMEEGRLVQSEQFVKVD